jgi:hypothetical protein
MKEIFQEYGGILITVLAIVALIVVIKFIIGDGQTGVVGPAFSSLVKGFVEQSGVVSSAALGA